jgi:hypothetical protein
LAELEEHKRRLKKGEKAAKREKNEEGEEKAHLPDDEDKIVTMIERIKERKEKHDLKVKDKADNAEVALGTSKINYNDREFFFSVFVVLSLLLKQTNSACDCCLVQEV